MLTFPAHFQILQACTREVTRRTPRWDMCAGDKTLFIKSKFSILRVRIAKLVYHSNGYKNEKMKHFELKAQQSGVSKHQEDTNTFAGKSICCKGRTHIVYLMGNTIKYTRQNKVRRALLHTHTHTHTKSKTSKNSKTLNQIRIYLIG